MQRLKKRAEYVAAAKGRRTARRAFVLETRNRGDEDSPRFGFTVTKKLARKAVERNRIRRRLKEVVRLTPSECLRPGFDHVIVGRRDALSQSFAELASDVASALRQAADETGRPASRHPRSSSR